MLSVSENETGAMIELSGVSSESDSSDDENGKATVSTTLKKPSSSSRGSSSSYSRVGTFAAVATINRSYNNDMNKKALQLQKVSRKKY